MLYYSWSIWTRMQWGGSKMFYSIKFLVSFIDPNALVVFIKLLYSSHLICFILASKNCLHKTPAHVFLHSFSLKWSVRIDIDPGLTSIFCATWVAITIHITISYLCSGKSWEGSHTGRYLIGYLWSANTFSVTATIKQKRYFVMWLFLGRGRESNL